MNVKTLPREKVSGPIGVSLLNGFGGRIVSSTHNEIVISLSVGIAEKAKASI